MNKFTFIEYGAPGPVPDMSGWKCRPLTITTIDGRPLHRRRKRTARAAWFYDRTRAKGRAR